MLVPSAVAASTRTCRKVGSVVIGARPVPSGYARAYLTFASGTYFCTRCLASTKSAVGASPSAACATCPAERLRTGARDVVAPVLLLSSPQPASTPIRTRCQPASRAEKSLLVFIVPLLRGIIYGVRGP